MIFFCFIKSLQLNCEVADVLPHESVIINDEGKGLYFLVNISVFQYLVADAHIFITQPIFIFKIPN